MGSQSVNNQGVNNGETTPWGADEDSVATQLLTEAAALVQTEEDAELLDEVGAIVAAEQSRLAWVERMADIPLVHLRLWGDLTLRGRAELIGPDAFTIRLEGSFKQPGTDWAIIPASAVLLIEGLTTRLAQETARPRLSWSLGQMLRHYLGWPVQAHCRDGSITAGHLHHVGADHVELSGPRPPVTTTVPFASLSALLV